MQSTRRTISPARRHRMRQFVVPVTLAIAALGGRSTLGAQSYTLDFGAGPSAPSICTTNNFGTGPLVLCSPTGTPPGGQVISQSYGDVGGGVDVQYFELERGLPAPNSLFWWGAGYGNRYGVLWSPTGSARIDLIPVAGTQITLNSFLLAAFGGPQTTDVNVFAIGSASPLYTFTGSISGTTSTAFNLDLMSSSGFRIEWKQRTGVVGLDDLRFTVSDLAAPPSVVPEPTTWALMGTGLAMLGVVAQRRRV